MLFVLALDYMRTRIGLKPSKYDKKDIELEWLLVSINTKQQGSQMARGYNREHRIYWFYRSLFFNASDTSDNRRRNKV